MATPLEQLLAHFHNKDPFNYRLEDIRGLQLQAADEYFQKMRRQIKVLEQRAQDTGTERILKLEDVLPLFFSDSIYKSYPESLIEQRNWKGLGTWVEATSAGANISAVDVEGVNDIDEWLERLRQNGIYLYCSGGTSGRLSLFHATASDRKFDQEMFQLGLRWATGAVADHTWAIFALFPARGPLRQMDSYGGIAQNFGRPESIYYFSDVPMRAADMNKLGRLRKAIGAGTATPSEIGAFEENSAKNQAYMKQAVDRMADALIRHQDDKCMMIGTWAPAYKLIMAAVERGFTKGLNPGSVMFAGGGLKGVVIPPDYKEQIQKAVKLDDSRYMRLYGMSEISTNFVGCSHHRYHIAPWLIPVVLDKAGEKIVEPVNGIATGRLAFYDLVPQGRWGALSTGDHGTLDLNPCPCGRTGPTLHDTIVRYIDLPGGDDRVQCAGNIDDYIRGALGAAA